MSTGPTTPDGATELKPLPPVQPPDGGFILQLFLIPMVIVAIIIMVWLMFSWLAQMGSDPTDLVRDLKKMNKDSWRKAYTLTNLLRNPEYSHLKDDRALCRELADVLDQEIDAGRTDEHHVRLRVFLCRSLGEFRVDDGLSSLVKAVSTDREAEELDVRYAAIEAIAVLADRQHVGPSTLQARPDVIAALISAARQRDRDHGELRSTAAFTLGVVGGPEATDQLSGMLSDASFNTRYNAALGLSRQGDLRAVDVLEEMLDADNPETVKDELNDSARLRKRGLVLANAIRACVLLSASNPPSDLEPLRIALEKLASSDQPSRIRLDAKEALIKLR